MLKARQFVGDTQERVARLQHPIAKRKARATPSPNSGMPSALRPPRKVKRANIKQLPRMTPPASPTSVSAPDDHYPRVTQDGPVIAAPPYPAADQAISRLLPLSVMPDTAAAIPPELIACIRELYKRRQDFLQEEGTLARRIKKIVARLKGQMTSTDDEVEEMVKTYHPLQPFLQSQRMLKAARMTEEKSLTKAVKTMSVWQSFGEPINGFGALGFGQIIGEAGDLSVYSNPAKLWKRMGLGLVGGERQRKCIDKEKAELHGYSPRRRSVMFVIGDSLIKKQNHYRGIYDQRKLVEIEKAKAEGLKVVPAARIPKGKHAEYRSEGHIHLRAKRYMEKRLLRDLWRAWRGQFINDNHSRDANPRSPTPRKRKSA